MFPSGPAVIPVRFEKQTPQSAVGISGGSLKSTAPPLGRREATGEAGVPPAEGVAEPLVWPVQAAQTTSIRISDFFTALLN
jgi:hypothetical protein